MRCIHKFKNIIFNYLLVYCVMINNISRKCTFRKTKKVYLLFISLLNIRQHDIDISIYVCCHLHLYYSYFYFLTPFNQTNLSLLFILMWQDVKMKKNFYILMILTKVELYERIYLLIDLFSLTILTTVRH